MPGSITRLLERHEAARRFGVPTLTLIAARDGVPALVQRHWEETDTHVVSVADLGDLESICRSFIERLGDGADLRRAALAAMATALDRAAGEVELALESGGDPERRSLLASYAARERRRPMATVVRALAAGDALPATLESLHGIARMLARPLCLRLSPGHDLAASVERGVAIAEAAPELGVAMVARPAAIDAALARLGDRAASVARQGLIRMPEASPSAPATPGRDPVFAARERAVAAYREALSEGDPGGARSAAEALLFARLEASPPTRGRFRLNVSMPFLFGPRPAEIDLLCEDLALAVEVDGYFHFTDSAAYRRDRRKDTLLQRHGLVVFRCLADDVIDRLEEVVSHIVDVMRWRATERGEDGRGD